MQNVKKVVIIGGGTSAWLAAAYLSNKKRHYDIVVVDKEVGSPVGVGEGTLLGFGNVMFSCGFQPGEWFFDIDASFKSGILFPKWGKDNTDVWHPFLFPSLGPRLSSIDLWSQTQEGDFKINGLSMYDISINHNKIDLNAANQGWYAFHVDCGKLVKFIQDKILNSRRVSLIKSEVVDIVRNGTDITNLILKDGQEVSGDLYIDCTGFKQLLHECPERVSLEGRLWCDTAIAGHVPYADRDKELNPYVISEAVDHGWVWNIPVQSRIGSGLVFNRSVTDVETAKKYFCDYWDNRISPENLKVIDWTPYYNKNQWHGNVVSIGLSAGFIEPLESTGVALIISGIEELANKLELDYFADSDRRIFNERMIGYFEDAVEFVSMHYAYVEKDTPFWQWVKSTRSKSKVLQWYEDQLANDTSLTMAGKGYTFGGCNWWTWLVQLGCKLGKKRIPIADSEVTKMLDIHKEEELSKHIAGVPHIAYIESRRDVAVQLRR